MEMAGPLFEPMGVETTDIPTHKLILALFSGGLLPIISLTFAHMLVVYSSREEQLSQIPTPVIDIDELSRKAGIIEKKLADSEIIDLPKEKIEKLEKKDKTPEEIYELYKEKYDTDLQP